MQTQTADVVASIAHRGNYGSLIENRSDNVERPIRSKGKLIIIAREEVILIVCIMGLLFLLPLEILASARNLIYGAILALELLFLLVDKAKPKRRALGPVVLTVIALFSGYLLLCWLLNGGSPVERYIQTAVFLSTLCVIYKYEWNKASLHSFKLWILLWLTICFVYWFLSGRVFNYYAAFYLHSNGFAVVIISAIALTLMSVERKPRVLDIVIILLGVFLLIVSNSRSAIVAIAATFVIAILFYIVISTGRDFTRLSKILFIATIGGVIAFSFIYPSLLGTQLGMDLELLSRKMFNKNFFSGRQYVWQMIFQAIQGHELFGLGLSKAPSSFFDTDLSSHNLYIQTILQSGIIGLAFILLIVYLLFSRLSKQKSWASCVATAFMIGVLIHEALEVSLTQNNIAVGLMYWVVFGIALSITSAKLYEES